MIIRKADVADIPRLVELSADAHTASRWNAEQFFRLVHAPEKICLVADEDHTVFGFGIAGIAADEMEVENILVAEERRLRGWGKDLLEKLLEIAESRGVKTVFLEVRESNLPAIMLYRSLAFGESGRRKGYYSDPSEDALMLSLKL